MDNRSYPGASSGYRRAAALLQRRGIEYGKKSSGAGVVEREDSGGGKASVYYQRLSCDFNAQHRSAFGLQPWLTLLSFQRKSRIILRDCS
ncbi:hypothetical protein D3C72_2141050 [compost metagenome]